MKQAVCLLCDRPGGAIPVFQAVFYDKYASERG
jgi:hypothetical protein